MKNEEEGNIWARNLLPLEVYSNRLDVTSKTRAQTWISHFSFVPKDPRDIKRRIRMR